MIPEIHRRLPPEILRLGLEYWNKYVDYSRCIKKYGKPDENDIVLDIGAHKGEFTFPANLFAKDIYAIEPDPDNWLYLVNSDTKILQDFKDRDLKVYNFAISNVNDFGKFNIAEDNSDSSIERTDTHRQKTAIKKFKRLDSLAFMDEITFLKIDAEGHEPEVLKSLGDYRPEYVAIDVSKERNGKSTVKECSKLLKEFGYVQTYHNKTEVLRGIK